MKVELTNPYVRFSQIIVGKCFQTTDGTNYMRVKDREGGKDNAVNLSSGEIILFVNTSVRVLPLNLKAVVDND